MNPEFTEYVKTIFGNICQTLMQMLKFRFSKR